MNKFRPVGGATAAAAFAKNEECANRVTIGSAAAPVTRVWFDGAAFGRDVRAYRNRERRGLSHHLTWETNVTASQQSRCERGLIPNMRTGTLISLAHWAGLSIEDYVRQGRP